MKLTALALAFVVCVAWLVVAVSKEADWLRERKRRERDQTLMLTASWAELWMVSSDLLA